MGLSLNCFLLAVMINIGESFVLSHQRPIPAKYRYDIIWLPDIALQMSPNGEVNVIPSAKTGLRARPIDSLAFDMHRDDKVDGDDYMQEPEDQPYSNNIAIPQKRWSSGLSVVRKRIHTCAFMRQFGYPVGLCFRKPSTWEPEQKPEDGTNNAYAYLERHWPVNSFLGGAVGR